MRENFSVGTEIAGSRRPFLVCLSRKLRLKNDVFKISGWCLVKIIREPNPDYSKICAIVGDARLPIKMLFRKGMPTVKNFHLNHFEFSVTDEQLVHFDVQNRILLDYPEATKRGRIIYRALDLFKGHGRHSRILIAGDRAIYLRQTVKNTMYITQRLANDLDSRKGNAKLFVAWLLSKLCFWLHGNVLMFEKESARFEESASAVFVKLMKRGAKNVYYILDKNAINYEAIKHKYGKHIVKKHSFKHLLYFFATRKFIGTETLGHALQLRCANRLVLRKFNSRRLEYVFLQHGVMYMISLDSDQRTGFYKQDYKKHKVIVSSKLEADHFIKYAGFKRRDLWVCGLPKFDKSVQNNDADKIVIMPTWRRWEANLAATDFAATEYYRMIRQIIRNTPKDLRKNLIVMPHPLMLEALKSASRNPLRKYLPEGEWSYDGVLRQCKLLITDYSSVAYDAFYRGANVVFYWGEKKRCMQQYGENAHLMLTKKLAFGPVCKKYEELPGVIREQYESGQARRYLNRYRKIVKYYDGKNTNRVVKKLIKEGIVK